jgi:hypothetical protein
MASVPTAPNDSNDDRSGTDKSDSEDEDKNKVDNEGSDSDATVNIDYRNALQKIKELQKKTKNLTAQCTRGVKQKDEMVRKHAQVLENRKTAYDGAKTRHKTEVSEIKSTWKRNVLDLKETFRTDMRTRDIEKRGFKVEISSLERDKTSDAFALDKLQSTLVKERAAFNEVKLMYAAARRNLDGLTEINKELSASLKACKKKLSDDQSVKFEHDEKMLEMQLQREGIQYEREKDKREDKEASEKALLDAKKDHAILTHSLRQKTKDDDVLRREIAKKKKDVQVSNNVGLIAAGLRNKQMQINNGQFNSHVSLEAVSSSSICFLISISCYSPL